jgi:hypothetical protein
MIQNWIRLHRLDANTLVATCVRMDFGSAQRNVCFSIGVEKDFRGTKAVDER